MKQPIVILLLVFTCTVLAGQSSDETVERITNILQKNAHDTTRIKLLHSLADTYSDSQYQQTLTIENKALSIAEQGKHTRHMVACYLRIGSLHRKHSDYRAAIRYLNSALTDAATIQNDNLLTDARLELGIAYLRIGKLDSSEISLKKGISLTDKSGNIRQEAALNNMMGNVLRERNRFDSATVYYLKATHLFERLEDDAGLTQSLSNMGNIQYLMGNYKKAEAYGLESLRFAEKIHSQSSIAYSNRLLGRIYRKLQRFDDAIRVYTIAITIYHALSASRDMSETYTAVGNIYYEQSDFVSALKAYHKALHINKANGDSVNLAYTYASLGSVMFSRKQYDQAIRYFDSTKLVSKQIQLAILEMDSNLGLSEVYHVTGKYKPAYEYYTRYIALRDSITSIEEKEKAAELEARYQNEKKENEIRALSAENELKALQLQQQGTQRNYLIALSILSLLVMGVLYRNYRIKQRTSSKLLELDEIKSRFFANISHEFRTPLNLILGPIYRKLETASAEDKRELEMMQRNAERLHLLINQLLDLSKLESGTMKLRITQNNIVRDLNLILESFHPMAARKQIDYKINLPSAPIEAYYDPDKLEKIAYNLLSNAFKFTPAGGTITVTVALHDSLVLNVKDSGPGIPEDSLSKIFDRFYQVDDSSTRLAGGTGVGLALARELALAHHGTLVVENNTDQGCQFTFSISLKKETYLKDMAGGDEEPETFLYRMDHGDIALNTPVNQAPLPLVLIAEDHRDMLTFISETLKEHFQIIQATDGLSAFEQATLSVPDLIITDWMMPRLDGHALCEQLKTHEATSHIPVIMLTARADQASKLAGLKTGADDYLTKPFDASELTIRVQNLIAQRKKLQKLFEKQITLQPKAIVLPAADADFIAKVMGIVEVNYGDSLFGVDEFTREAGLSRTQLHRKLKALTDKSPGEFIRQYRLERAKQLLRTPGIQVSEVAFQTGFNNPSHFAKAFKDFTGIAPSEFR